MGSCVIHAIYACTYITRVDYTLQSQTVYMSSLVLISRMQPKLTTVTSAECFKSMEPETPPKNRSMSGTEYSWYKAVPIGTGITVLALHLSRPLPLPLLQSTLHKLLNSHPVLASSLTPTSIHLIPTPSPPPILTTPLPPRVNPSLSPLHSVLERELNLNPWAPPPQSNHAAAAANFHATLYEGGAGADEAAVLALRFHTAVCDRTSAVAVLKGLLGLMTEGKDVILGDGEVNLGIEELIRKEDSWKPFWARGKDLVGYSVNGLRSSGLRFADTGAPRRSEVVRLVMSRDETKRLLHVSEMRSQLVWTSNFIFN